MALLLTRQETIYTNMTQYWQTPLYKRSLVVCHSTLDIAYLFIEVTFCIFIECLMVVKLNLF